MNTFGTRLRLTTFGESHGPAMGGVLDGLPPGVRLDMERLGREMARRRPGADPLTSPRREDDKVEILSGFSADGLSLGSPVGFIVRNTGQRSSDYDSLADIYRPNHADYTYERRYGIRDPRGGGRSSARETVSWTAAGALAAMWLDTLGVTVQAVVTRVGAVDAGDVFDLYIRKGERKAPLEINPSLRAAMEEQVAEARRQGNSVGGRVGCLVTGLPAGIGDPVADKLQARLAMAMMSINGAKAFEYGIGTAAASSLGSDTADSFALDEEGKVVTLTNHSGGIQGGISNGMPVYFSVSFKPTPTIAHPLKTLDRHLKAVTLEARGRHDPCIALRGAAVVEAMARLTIADMILSSR